MQMLNSLETDISKRRMTCKTMSGWLCSMLWIDRSPILKCPIQVPSNSRPGEYVYENIHTEERVAWYPVEVASKTGTAAG